MDTVMRWLARISVVGCLFMAFLYASTHWIYLHGGVQPLYFTQVVVIRSEQRGTATCGEGVQSTGEVRKGVSFIDTGCTVEVLNR